MRIVHYRFDCQRTTNPASRGSSLPPITRHSITPSSPLRQETNTQILNFNFERAFRHRHGDQAATFGAPAFSRLILNASPRFAFRPCPQVSQRRPDISQPQRGWKSGHESPKSREGRRNISPIHQFLPINPSIHRGAQRLTALLNAIRDWNLFLAFNIVDSCTEGKDREPLRWLFQQVAGKVESQFTETDIL
jgi:hypothetical protein